LRRIKLGAVQLSAINIFDLEIALEQSELLYFRAKPLAASLWECDCATFERVTQFIRTFLRLGIDFIV